MIVLLSSVPNAAANPADAFGIGARGPAMAGAQAASVNDASANYYNPAALAEGNTIRIDVGYQLARPMLHLNGQDSNTDGAHGIAAGIRAPGQLAGRPIAIGASLFLPDQRLTRVRTLQQHRPRFVLYDNRPQRFLLATNVAMQISPRLLVGAGLSYMSSTSGGVELAGRIGFPDANDSQLDLAIDVDLRSIRYFQLGVLAIVSPWLKAALTFRSQFELTLDQDFDVRGDVGPANADPVIENGFLTLKSLALDHFQPAQLTAGFSAQITPALLVSFDLAWHRWSRFKNPAAQLEIDLDVGEFNDSVDLADRPPNEAANFHDIVVSRLGLEWTASQSVNRTWHVRGGVALEPSPAPEQVGNTNFVDNDKYTTTVGVGLTLPHLGSVVPNAVSFDAFVAFTVLPERFHRKLSSVDRVGDLRAGGSIVQAGLTSRWQF